MADSTPTPAPPTVKDIEQTLAEMIDGEIEPGGELYIASVLERNLPLIDVYDSLGVLDYIARVEQAYGIRIDDDALSEVYDMRVTDLAGYVHRQLQEREQGKHGSESIRLRK
ncbi:hypothetical protein HYU19_06205 [Candidatus Woesearchaeota archaeon]|nr:hypothetical protein [Candidatus Woesearchaeota archaeon]